MQGNEVMMEQYIFHKTGGHFSHCSKYFATRNHLNHRNRNINFREEMGKVSHSRDCGVVSIRSFG